MKTLKLLIISVGLLLLSGLVQAQEQGAYLGSISSETPSWFKHSFLEFEEDVAEAATQNRRVMLYFHQEGCPYCAKLVEENFAQPAIEQFVREHFDGIQINMWGDREIVSVQGRTFTEKTFASALKVQYTPTILFLNEQGKVALRLNGYYPPKQFQLALEYAAMKMEKKQSFSEFVLSKSKLDKDTTQSTGLINQDFFEASTNLKSMIADSDTPVAVYFEAKNCAECEVMHKRILTDKPTRELVYKMKNIQLDIASDEMLITPEGERMSQQEYAQKLNIAYTPAVVLLDNQGKEVHRMDGFLKTFHFQSSLAYVLDKAYITEPSFQRYISARGEHLREQGYDTDIWGYESFHPGKTVK